MKGSISARVGSTCYLNFLQWPQHVYQSEPMHGSIGCTKSSETQALSSPSAGTLAQYPFQRSKLHQICAQFLSGLLRKQNYSAGKLTFGSKYEAQDI
nr:hypothetical protein CFP56_26914 [Quercus suber]